MTALEYMLHRSVVVPFYQQHAGLFLFSFFILFGIQPSAADVIQFHYSLILSILGSPSFFFLAFGVWLLYSVKMILFVLACLKKESYDFVYLLNGVDRKRRLAVLINMVVTMMSPVLIYAGVVIVIAAIHQLWLPGFAVAAAMALLILLCVYISVRLIQNGKNNQLIKKAILVNIPPGLFSFMLQFIFRKQFITLLILKTVSFTALYFFAETDSRFFEGRMLWLLFITVLAGHGVIIFRNFHFVENELYFHRNLPVRRLYMLLSLLAVYSILLIPEWWALKGIILVQHEPAEYCWLVLTGPPVLLLIHSILYSDDLKMEDFLGVLFGMWVVFIFFSLSSTKWLMPAVGCVIGGIIFFLSYYKYEKKMTEDERKTSKSSWSKPFTGKRPQS